MSEATIATPPAATPPPAPPAQPAPARFADAVLVPSNYREKAAGPRSWHRVRAVIEVAEPYLGVEPGKGLAWMYGTERRVDGEEDVKYYIVGKKGVTEYQPKGHPKEGQPRFAWTPSPSDPQVLVGTLIDPNEES